MEGTNLLGKSHRKYVQEQIRIRQEKLGNRQKTSEDIDWMNSKTSWVRLASSVNIENSTIRVPLSSKELYKSANYKAGGDTTSSERISPDINTIIKINLNAMNEEGLIGEDIEIPTGEQRLELLGLGKEWMGSELAQNLVLVGGTEAFKIKEIENNYVVDHIRRNGITGEFAAYKGKDFGLVAMPGITSFDMKSKNMGSLKESTVNIRVNDADQLELIDTLYLRLGYTMFLEWGNSSYYNNDGEYVKGIFASPTLLYDFLTQSTPTQQEIDRVRLTKMTDRDGDGVEELMTDQELAQFERKVDALQNLQNKIEEERKKSCGNYDALLGRVSNFTWDFNPQGYYDVILTLISWGDIIDSLNINSFYPDVTLEIGDDGTVDRTKVDRKNSSALEAFIYEATLPPRDTTVNSFLVFSTQKDSQSPIKRTLTSKINSKIKLFFAPIDSWSENQEASDYSETLNYNREITNSKGKVISCSAVFGETQKYFYLRFGDLLDFIKYKLLIYGIESPIIDIDTRPDRNFCYNPQINISADPSKVMIRRKLPKDPESKLPLHILSVLPKLTDNKYTTKGVDGPFEEKYTLKDGETIDTRIESFDSKIPGTDVIGGDIMNIYFEKEYLYSVIDSLKNKKTGKLSLNKFIQELLSTANECLGGVNKLDLRIKDDRILEIYDQTPLYGVKKKEKEEIPQQFNIYGVKTNEGSFVTDFSLKTELTNEFATTVAIGAQANGEVVGEDSTMLSKWNFGLVDRFIPKKIDSIARDLKSKSKELEELNALSEKMKDLWIRHQVQTITTKAHELWFPVIETEQFANYTKLQRNFLQALIKVESTIHSKDPSRLSNQIGMLPINLSLELDGLSGIRIYDQINVDTRFLPSYYPNYLIFIIKGVSHSFKGNRWVTKIETIAQPKIAYQEDLDLFNKFSYGPLSIPEAPPTQAPSETPNATDLRFVLEELGYQEKGIEISEAGDISQPMKVAAEAIFRTIATQLPDLNIVVTSGNDAEHASITEYTSYHTVGNALDFVISPATENNKNQVLKILQEFAAGNDLPPYNFSFIDEYSNPTKKATGYHYHLVMGGGRAAQASKQKALALAKEGKITPRSIVGANLQQQAIQELNRPF